MTGQRVAFPSFRVEEPIKPYDMRQLVTALEYRFQSLESSDDSIFPDTTLNEDLSNIFAPLSHTHLLADISDFEVSGPTSIFALNDVSGSPAVGETLIWDGDEFVPGTASAAGTSLALHNLTDVFVPNPSSGQVLTYVGSSGQWEAIDVTALTGGGGSLFDLSDTDIATQVQYDFLFNADGDEWQATAGKLKWNPAIGMVLRNGFAIHWEDGSFVAQELLNFVPALSGTPISHATVAVNTAVTLTGSYATVAGMTIDQNNLISGDDYLLIAKANLDTDDVAGVHAFITVIDAQGASLSGFPSENEVESFQSVTDGFSGLMHQFSSVFTCDQTGTALLEMQMKETGTGSYRDGNHMSMFVMNLTQFGADADWDAASSGGTQYNGVWGGLSQSVTVGDGVSDYLFIGTVESRSGGGGYTASCAFEIGGVATTTLGAISRSNSGEKRIQTIMWIEQAVPASTAVRTVAQGGSFGRFYYFSIVAIKLDAFSQYESSIITSPTQATAEVIYDYDTLSFTSATTATPWAFIGGMGVGAGGVQCETGVEIDGAGRVRTSWDIDYQQDVAGRSIRMMFPETLPTINAGASVDVIITSDPTSTFGSDNITYSFALAVPMSLGGTVVPSFIMGDPSHPTRIDGSTITLGAPTNITGAVTLASTLDVTGAATLLSTLDIADEVTFSSKLNANTTTVTTTSHTAADEHVILVDDDTAAATVTITLPAAATKKTIYHIKKLGTTASVIIDGDGTDTIDGDLTITLTMQYESVMLISDGTNWNII